MDRIRQLFATFNATRRADPRLVPLMAAVSGGVLVLFLVLAAVTGGWILYPILGVLFALMAALIILGRRAQATALSQIEGRPGAAAAVLQTMRGPWKVTPAIAFNRREDLIHLVVGRPGVVLVAEGSSPARVRQLLAKERRRVMRAAGDVPVTEVIVGDGEGMVSLKQLTLHMARLPRAIKPREVGPLDRKMSALKAQEPPLPKGPMPRAPKKMR